jgi:asparagine synthase (glutamine-hydrolysing)
MADRLAHRGPDDTGYACIEPQSRAVRRWGRDLPDDITLAGGVLIGHRRLSILDLTQAGHQPMVSDDALTVLAFNGEIYNFLELRNALSAEGITFRGTGDTEVLLKAYECWGPGVFNRLNGMWAFVLWDGRRRTLVACRDRFGVKPLYYATVDGTLIFGSEIKALLAYPGAFRGFQEERVLEFVRDGRTDHTAETLFAGVRSLPPGSYMEVAGEETRITRYWTLPDEQADGRRDPSDFIAELTTTLTDAVRLRVRSDVPIGTMMSGGLDSTAITSLIREQQRQRGDAGRTFEGLTAFHHTFSACWPGSRGDEESEIDIMCSELGLVSHKLYPTPEKIAEALPKVVYHLDEPFIDPIAAVQYSLMQEARGLGVKVVLNGHGSDEILGGYHKQFVPPFLVDLLLAGRLGRFMQEQRAFRGSGWSWPLVMWHLAMRLTPWTGRISPLTPSRVLELARGAAGVFADSHDGNSGAGTTEDFRPYSFRAALWYEFASRNLPRWLRMEDRMSMAWSVESRLPFMDYRLVELAFRIPDGLKLRNGYNKYILRQAMRDLLPRRLVEARNKRPFVAPYAEWLRGQWKPMAEDLLYGSPRVATYLRYPAFRTKLQKFLDGNSRALPTYLVWRLLSAELWLREFSGERSYAG